MPLKPHPTDEDKVVFVKPEYLIDGWKKPWVGLTDVEIIDIMDEELTTQSTEHFALCQAIEAKLKEKNT